LYEQQKNLYTKEENKTVIVKYRNLSKYDIESKTNRPTYKTNKDRNDKNFKQGDVKFKENGNRSIVTKKHKLSR
jgi:hypothetical protein